MIARVVSLTMGQRTISAENKKPLFASAKRGCCSDTSDQLTQINRQTSDFAAIGKK